MCTLVAEQTCSVALMCFDALCTAARTHYHHGPPPTCSARRATWTQVSSLGSRQLMAGLAGHEQGELFGQGHGLLV
jgi:hypothetical protein